LSGKALEKWKMEFWQSSEGRTRLHAMRSYTPRIESDGSFVIDGVAPGAYELTAQFGPTQQAPATGSIHRTVNVPESGNSTDDPLDIGTFEFR
jgi:hypothetical protein